MFIRWIPRKFTARRTGLRNAESNTAVLVQSIRRGGRVAHKDVYLGSFRVLHNGILDGQQRFLNGCRVKLEASGVPSHEHENLLCEINSYVKDQGQTRRREL